MVEVLPVAFVAWWKFDPGPARESSRPDEHTDHRQNGVRSARPVIDALPDIEYEVQSERYPSSITSVLPQRTPPAGARPATPRASARGLAGRVIDYGH